MVRQALLGASWLGKTRAVRQDMAGPLGWAWQPRRGGARQRHGEVGQAGQGQAALGAVSARLGHGEAGNARFVLAGQVEVRQLRLGAARSRTVRLVEARFGRRGNFLSKGQKVMATEFRWAPGSRMSKKIAEPSIIGATLDTLQQENGGRITARVVVDAARPINSPLHSCFEWDDVRAAELHREDQARHVINSIRIVQRSDDPKKEPQLIRAYVNLEETVGDDTQRAYLPMARVFNDADLLAQAIRKAASELRSVEEKYAEFEGIARAARQAREQIEHQTQAA